MTKLIVCFFDQLPNYGQILVVNAARYRTLVDLIYGNIQFETGTKRQRRDRRFSMLDHVYGELGMNFNRGETELLEEISVRPEDLGNQLKRDYLPNHFREIKEQFRGKNSFSGVHLLGVIVANIIMSLVESREDFYKGEKSLEELKLILSETGVNRRLLPDINKLIEEGFDVEGRRSKGVER